MSTNLRTAAQQALEALEYYEHRKLDWCYADEAAITALREALTEEALQRLTDANQEIEAVLGQPELKPKFYAPRRLSNEEVAAFIGLRRHETEQEPVPKSTWQKLYEAAIDQRNKAVAVNQELLKALKEAEPMLDAMLKNITQHLPEFQRMPALDMVRAAIAKAEGQA
jgi:hypothetical protein